MLEDHFEISVTFVDGFLPSVGDNFLVARFLPGSNVTVRRLESQNDLHLIAVIGSDSLSIRVDGQPKSGHHSGFPIWAIIVLAVVGGSALLTIGIFYWHRRLRHAYTTLEK
jgi:hypothetical protein